MNDILGNTGQYYVFDPLYIIDGYSDLRGISGQSMLLILMNNISSSPYWMVLIQTEFCVN